MKKIKPVSQCLRGALALTLALSLFSGLAYAEEGSSTTVADKLIENDITGKTRFAQTGDVGKLFDVDTYVSKGGGVSASDEALLQTIFPQNFDLRDEGVMTRIKNQSPWGTCWGFAAIAAAETSIMSELGWTVDDNELDLSELQVAWFAYTPLPTDAGPQAGEGVHTVTTDAEGILNPGGNAFTATSILSSGIGPVSETEIPYRNKEGLVYMYDPQTPMFYSGSGDWSVDEDKRFLQSIELEETSILPSPAGETEAGDYQYNKVGTQAIKQELSEGKAVQISFKADTSMPGQVGESKFINTDTWAHYTYDENIAASHAVAIVGWDDDYSKDNFLAGHQPEDDGAWIVKNSWGSVAEEFPHFNPLGWGENGEGYFYLSYYDRSLEDPETMDFYTENFGREVDSYVIDQHDYLPSPGVKTLQCDGATSMANVFLAEEHQRVRSLSCETATPDTAVTYELYLLNDDYENPKDGELLTTLTETYRFGGYHRVQLGEGFVVEKGKHYSVVVTLAVESKFEVLTDTAINKTGMDFINVADPTCGLTVYSVGVINRGESFLLEKNEWKDWADEITRVKTAAASTPEGDLIDYDNFPIKAYSDILEAPPAPQTVAVPDLSNMTEAEVLAALNRLGLEGRAGAAEYSATIEAGRVVRQDTKAGTEVSAGTVVVYHLSLGKDPAVGQKETSTGTTSGAKGLVSTGDGTFAVAQGVSLIALASVLAAGAAIKKRRKSR